MGWKRLTFILIPHSKETIKQFKVSRGVLYGTTAFFVVAVAVMIFYIIGFEGKSFYHAKTQDLILKNSILQEQLATFDSSLSIIETSIAHLESLNTVIIDQSGISEVDLKDTRLKNLAINTLGEQRFPRRVLAVINQLDLESIVFEINYTTLFERCQSESVYVRHLPLIRPTRGNVTREFGRSLDKYTQTERSHPGVDITNDEGTPIVATADGVVETINFSSELGRFIVIDHQHGYKTRYAHMQTPAQMAQKIRIEKNDKVIRGQIIGTIGRTGNVIAAIPPHVMYSVYHNGIPVDPMQYFFATEYLADASEETPEDATE